MYRTEDRRPFDYAQGKQKTEDRLQRLEFNHFVVATADGTIFASARDEYNRVHNFIITRYGDVKQQVDSRFEPVSTEDADNIREMASSYYSVAPTYRIRTINFS